MIKRNIEVKINEYLESDQDKILFIWGPRRSGKTTILKKIGKKLGAKVYNFDFLEEKELFSPSRSALDKIVEQGSIILIDEVQTYPEATLALKLLHDEYNVKVVATGSSELRQTTNDFDSLAGRYKEIYCLPLSVEEIIDYKNPASTDIGRVYIDEINKGFIYGTYPEIYFSDISNDDKQDLLNNILNTYVLKDVVSIYNLKDLKLAKNILTKIALQIGSEVSLREIANSLQANVSTVSNYIEIFVKNYILIELPSFKTNARRAVSENKKYYFYDLGIRNALIKDFRVLDLRQDKGAVFENFVITEIEKVKRLIDTNFSTYFYREYGGKEVDLVLESYEKEYKVFDIKTSRDIKEVNKIFPQEHELGVINMENSFDIIKKLYK